MFAYTGGALNISKSYYMITLPKNKSPTFTLENLKTHGYQRHSCETFNILFVSNGALVIVTASPPFHKYTYAKVHSPVVRACVNYQCSFSTPQFDKQYVYSINISLVITCIYQGYACRTNEVPR